MSYIQLRWISRQPHHSAYTIETSVNSFVEVDATAFKIVDQRGDLFRWEQFTTELTKFHKVSGPLG